MPQLVQQLVGTKIPISGCIWVWLNSQPAFIYGQKILNIGRGYNLGVILILLGD